MKKFLLLTMIFMLAFSCSVFGTTKVGGTFSNIAGEQAWGITVDTSHDAGFAVFGLDSTVQGGGSITWGTWHAEAVFDVGPFGLKLFVDGLFKKYIGQETGQNRDAGAAIQLPPFGIEGLDVGIGVFGRNTNPFGAPNALDDLEGIGYNRNDFDGLGLENISPPPKGLSIQSPGNYLNMLVYADWEINDDWSLKVRAMPQLSGEDKVHQFIISPQVSFDVRDKLDLVLEGDLGFQTFKDVIEKEVAVIASLSLEL